MDPPIGSPAWIDAELRERLGEGATAGELTFEGRALHVSDARLPLGPLTLTVDRAELELGAGAPIGPFPLSVRLVSLRGVLSLASIALSVPIELRASGPAAPRWFSGTIAARGARIGAVAFDLDATLDLAAEGARLAGRVRVADAPIASAGEIAITADPAIEIDLATRGALESLEVEGRVFASRIAIGRRSAPDAACRFDDVSAVVDVNQRRLRYRDLSARAHGARISGWGRVPFGAPSGGAEAVPLAALAIGSAGVGILSSLAALAGRLVRASRAPIADADVIAVPSDLTASGEIMITHDRAISAAITLDTPRSAIRLHVAPTTGALEGSTLRGRISVEDAIVLGIFPGPVRPRRTTILDVDARLTGGAASPGLTGRIAAETMILRISDDPAQPTFSLADVSVLLDVSRDQLAWHRLAGRLYGGTFTSSGRIGIGLASGLDATVAWSGVRVEQLPTQSEGASRLATLIEGAASGDLAFERHAFEGAEIRARGRISIADPRYLFVRAFAPDLARVGLPAVSSAGRGPLTARLTLAHGKIIADRIEAAVFGVETGGEVRVGLDGRLGGAIVVHLLRGYLGQSAILAVSTALSERVAIPVEIGGTVRAPEVRTDAIAILEGLLVDNRVGDAVKSVLDGLGEWGSTRRRKGR